MSNKVVKPSVYKLQEGYVNLGSSERLTAQVVYRDVNGFKFFDLVITIGNRVFLVKPWSVYSPKTLNVYNWELNTLGLSMLSK